MGEQNSWERGGGKKGRFMSREIAIVNGKRFSERKAIGPKRTCISVSEFEDFIDLCEKWGFRTKQIGDYLDMNKSAISSVRNGHTSSVSIGVQQN